MTGRNALSRVVVLVTPILLFTLSSVAVAPAFADQLTLGGCNTSLVTVTTGSATVNCTPFNDPPALVATFTETGNLATGVFGVLSSVTDSGGTGLGSGSDQTAYLSVLYVFSVSGVSNGTVNFAINTNGVLATNTGTSNAEFEYTGQTGTINNAALPVGGVPLSSGSSKIVLTDPITNGTVEVGFTLALTTDCAGSQQCTSSADFLDPTTITSATAFDANGNPVSATFVSESGFNPNAAAVVPAPEPSSIVLMLAGCIAIGLTALKVRLG